MVELSDIDSAVLSGSQGTAKAEALDLVVAFAHAVGAKQTD